MKETLCLHNDPFEGEDDVQPVQPDKRNPIQRSFGAGINQPKRFEDRRRMDRVVRRRDWRREIERDG